jgi:hypothetical protein
MEKMKVIWLKGFIHIMKYNHEIFANYETSSRQGGDEGEMLG